MQRNLTEQFSAARRVSAPLILVRTQEPGATIRQLGEAEKVTKQGAAVAQFRWDVLRGLQGVNEAGVAALDAIFQAIGAEPVATQGTDGLPLVLETASQAFPHRSILFILNAQRYLAGNGEIAAKTVQGLWNLRDVFKANGRTCVLLAPEMVIPPELMHDVVPLTEPLPDDKALGEIVVETYKSGGLTPPKPEVVTRAVDSLRGLSTFSAEQAAAMALTRQGLDHDALSERHAALISEAPGLSVVRRGPKFADIGGCEQIKTRLRNVAKGKRGFNAVVWLDEIEKGLAGATANTSDNTGVKQGVLSSFLTRMQEAHNGEGYRGFGLVGPPGTAKSMFTKSIAFEFDRTLMAADVGELLGGIVGESEQKTRNFFQVIDAISGGNALFAFTSNGIENIPAELIRRFKLGIYYFGLPTAEERKLIWDIYFKKFGLPEQELPADEQWTGADIERCASQAADESISLIESAKSVIPFAVSSKARLDALEAAADGHYLSAAYPGAYRRAGAAAARVAGQKGRKIELLDGGVA